MSDRRSGPPLFDLMRERGEQPDAPRPIQAPQPTKKQGESSVVPAPAAPTSSAEESMGSRQTAWDTSGGVSRAERSAAAMLDEPVQSDSGVTLSVPKFYTLIAVGLLLIVGAWAGGYQLGKSDGKEEMSQFVDEPVVNPPTTRPSTINPAQDSSTNPERITRNPTRSDPEDSQTPATTNARNGSILTTSGFAQQDPRVPGMNYLVLATLPPEQATDAISFLGANGISVIGVPQLDSGGSSANNPSRYTLYSLGLAIPGNRWSAMSAQRREHQQRVAQLGQRWQREHRGGSDFSQTNWEKFER